MNANVHQSNTHLYRNDRKQSEEDTIDLEKLFTLLVNHYKVILFVTFLFLIVGSAYSFIATPTYQSQTLIELIQSNDDNPIPALNSATQIEKLKSSSILNQVVDSQNLTTIATPDYFPIIGRIIDKLMDRPDKEIKISVFDVPKRDINKKFKIKVINSSLGKYELLSEEGTFILTGIVNKEIKAQGFNILVSKLKANNKVTFTIQKISKSKAFDNLKDNFSVSEKGKNSNILQLTLVGSSEKNVNYLLNKITDYYLAQNESNNNDLLSVQYAKINYEINENKNNIVSIKKLLSAPKLTLIKLNKEQENLANELALIDKSIYDYANANANANANSKINMLFQNRNDLIDNKINIQPTNIKELLLLNAKFEVANKIKLELQKQKKLLKDTNSVFINNIVVIEKSSINDTPIKPKKALIIVLSTLLGLIISTAGVLLKSALNKKIEDIEDIQRLNVPVLAKLPYYHGEIINNIIAINKESISVIEKLRSLRTYLFTEKNRTHNLVMISSVNMLAGSTFISINLAMLAAKAHQRVLLIDANMREGKISQSLSLTKHIGLSDYLLENAEVNQIISATDVNNLFAIGCGHQSDCASELLMSSKFKQLLLWSKDEFDLVIINSPSIQQVTDPLIIAKYTSLNLLVTQKDQTIKDELSDSLDMFSQHGVVVDGIIFNGISK